MNILETYIKETGYSQREISRKSGVAESMISKGIHSKKSGFEVLLKIIKGLHPKGTVVIIEIGKIKMEIKV